MFPLGESTLALDEEMLQMLDVIDPVKPAANNACPTTVNRHAQEEPSSSSSAAFAPLRALAPASKIKSDRAPQLTGQRPHRAPSTKQGVCGHSDDCKRPGWSADCKDLAQRLLFSEDSEETEHAQRGSENIQSSQASACINGLSCKEIKNCQQVGSSTK